MGAFTFVCTTKTLTTYAASHIHICVYKCACIHVYRPFQPAAEDKLERIINQSISQGIFNEPGGMEIDMLGN